MDGESLVDPIAVPNLPRDGDGLMLEITPR
jgi:hypothetical protein